MTKITIAPAGGTWTVRAGGAVIAETSKALALNEDGYPPVIYFPRGDIAMAFLDRTDHATTCPHKGEAGYFSIVTKSTTIENAAWTYDSPKADVADIAGYVAFYARDGITIEQV